jgi:aerobic-type carbon monoxide dehydrogenase small subunit (CoxS/CutS family)
LEPNEDGAVRVDLNVNGHLHRVLAKSQHTLLQVLRDDLHLAGVREACGVGMCGACTVLLDGRPISSCLLLAPLANGRAIETIESPDQSIEVIQQAYIDHTAFQCSFCTPGFVLMTHALLQENPRPTSEEVRDYLAGNLCRCGSYVKIEAAVLDAAQRLSRA